MLSNKALPFCNKIAYLVRMYTSTVSIGTIELTSRRCPDFALWPNFWLLCERFLTKHFLTLSSKLYKICWLFFSHYINSNQNLIENFTLT